MRRSVVRRIKAGLIAFTIVDAGVLVLGVQRMHTAPRSVIGNSELAMQQFTLPPLFNSVPNGALKQDAAMTPSYMAPPALPARSTSDIAAPEAEPVPAALLAEVPIHRDGPAQAVVNHNARRSHTAYARSHALPYQPSGASPLSPAFDPASSSSLPNPYYLPDLGPAAPDSQSAIDGTHAAMDATASAIAPPAGDAAVPVAQDLARPQAELAPSDAPRINPDMSAAEQPSLPSGGSSPVVTATP